MSTRTDLAGAIRLHAPTDWIVLDHATPPENISARTAALVMIEPGDWTPATDGGQASLRIGHEIYIVTPIIDPAKVEDALEEIGPALAEIIDGLSNIEWTVATREVIAPGFHARKFTTVSYAI